MQRFRSALSLRHLLLALGISALIAVSAFTITEFTASAAADAVQKLYSPSFGITNAQTVRVSVANITGKDIQVYMSLIDEKGQVQVQCNGLVVEGRETYWMDLDGATLVSKLPERAQLRAQIWVKTTDSTVFTKLKPSIEIFDTTTGQTTVSFEDLGL